MVTSSDTIVTQAVDSSMVTSVSIRFAQEEENGEQHPVTVEVGAFDGINGKILIPEFDNISELPVLLFTVVTDLFMQIWHAVVHGMHKTMGLVFDEPYTNI